MADRSVSVPVTLSDLGRRDARGQIFQADLLKTFVPFELQRSNSAGHVEEGVFTGVSHAPAAKNGSQRSPFWGILSISE